MTAPATRAQATGRRGLRLCLWCVISVLVEVGLYASYRRHDGRFHWFTHFFIGAAAALIVMAVVAARSRRPVPLPLVWLLVGHLVAMFPDFLFAAGMAHYRWMEVFLGHLSSHFVPGRNLTWYLVFLASLAVYLATLDRLRRAPALPRRRHGVIERVGRKTAAVGERRPLRIGDWLSSEPRTVIRLTV